MVGKSHAERIEDVRQFLDTPILGVPVLWFYVAVLAVCMMGMVWVVIDERRKR